MDMMKSQLKTEKKDKIKGGDKRNVYWNFHLRDGFGMEFTAS